MMKLLQLDRLFSDGYHNAFTDLIYWKGRYYLSFRTAQSHGVSPAGDVVIYRSGDLAHWELCVRLDTTGDDRDPKLIDAGDSIGVVFGTWFPRWGDGTRSIVNGSDDLISHISVSRDGLAWSTPRQVYGVNYWLWRILPADGGYYCAAYHFARRDDRDMRTVHLLYSEDLFNWRLRCQIRAGGGAGEPVLYQPEPGHLHCIARTLEPNHHSWIGRSRAPFTHWEWVDMGVMVHAPVVLETAGRWIVAGRSQEADLPDHSYVHYDDAPPNVATFHTTVWTVNGAEAVHPLTIPSGGDCSYAGLAKGPNGEILMSYYSQHERFPLPKEAPTPADVYLARLGIAE